MIPADTGHAVRIRRLCIAFALIVVVAAGVLGWTVTRSYRNHLLAQEKAHVQARLNAIGTNLGAVLGRRHALTTGVAAFASVHGSDPSFEHMFELYATGLRANDTVVRAIQIFPKGGSEITYPVAGNEATLGRTFNDLVNDDRPEVRADVARALNSRFPTMGSPRELRQGGLGLVMRQAIYRDQELWGLAVVVINIDALLDRAGIHLAGEDIALAISDSEGRVFRGDASIATADPVVCRIPLTEGFWTISARPVAGWLADARVQLLAVRLSALLVALLMGLTTYLIAARQTSLALMLKSRTRELAASEMNYRHLFEKATAAQASADAARLQITQMLERISDGFAMLDREGRYTYVNPALATLLGCEPAEMVGRDVGSLFPEPVGLPIQAAYKRAMDEQKLVELDHYYQPLGRWFRHRLFPSPAGLSVYSKDITETRHAEEALRASEEGLRELFQKVPIALRYTDRNDKIVFINDSFTRVFGYTGQDLPDLQSWWPRAYPSEEYRHDVIRRWKSAVRAGAGGGEILAGEYLVTCKDGTQRMVEISGTMMSGGVLAVLFDVTERKMAEQRVREARDQTAKLLAAAEESRAVLLSLVEDQKAAEAALRLHGAALEAAANAIVITDSHGTIEWANPAFAALSGWAVDESVGRSLRELVKSGRQDEAFYRRMWATLTAGKVWRGEIVNKRKDGTFRTEDMTITPLRDEHGGVSHYIAIKQDITDHKTMEAQFLHAQRMEALGTLAGGIAHDLNNILSPMMMVTGLLKHKLSDEADQELLEMLQSGASRGAGIIKQLLTFSRGQEGERVVLQPRHLIKEIIAMMRETFPREIDLRQSVEPGLWTVLADPTQLHQVLLNLCVNARDAMPSGGCLTVGASNVILDPGAQVLPPGIAPGAFVAMEVRDTGQGIAPEIKYRIFDPFFTTKPLGKGTGLGLSTVLGIVRNHQGFITVDSASGKGSVFKVYLPASARAADAPAETQTMPPLAVGNAQTILIVDDERDIRDTTRILLERQNYRVIAAGNGEEALAQFMAHRTAIRIVLTDVMMPVMNGMDLIRALRAIDPSLFIVATSGLGEASRAAELAELRVADVLSKPFDGPTLLNLLQRRLSERR